MRITVIKMYIHYMFGAIFIVYILCVHCDNASKDNEIKQIYGKHFVSNGFREQLKGLRYVLRDLHTPISSDLPPTACRFANS